MKLRLFTSRKIYKLTSLDQRSSLYTMSNRLKTHAPYLHVLAKGNAKQREGILRGADKELIYCLCECALNVLQGNVQISSEDKSKLKKYKRCLRDLSNKKISLTKKRKLLLRQKGGWVTALIAPILGTLASLLFKKIKTKSK